MEDVEVWLLVEGDKLGRNGFQLKFCLLRVAFTGSTGIVGPELEPRGMQPNLS